LLIKRLRKKERFERIERLFPRAREEFHIPVAALIMNPAKSKGFIVSLALVGPGMVTASGVTGGVVRLAQPDAAR
jgi:hypothetical protein